jgi:chromosome partitioning protein
MKVLSVVSQKGGVGKTTVSLNLALAFARRGHRLLLVDCDPQGAIGLSLQRAAGADGLAAYVARKLPLARVVTHTKFADFDLLPMGNIAIQDTAAFSARLNDGTELTRLLSECGAYDLVMFDTPSGFSGATMGSLKVSTHVISPLQAEPLAVRSASQLLTVLGALRQEGSAVALAGLLLTMLDVRNGDSLSVATEVWTDFPDAAVLQTNIPRDPVFLKASGAGVPVGLLSRSPPPVAALFDQLAQELESKLGMQKEGNDDGPISLLA